MFRQFCRHHYRHHLLGEATVPPLPPPEATASPSPPPSIGFEERFGTRWVVWIGGLALALGGIFLVRYTIQQGLIGPGVRVILGGLLALALVAVGEWARRGERLSGLPGLSTANIPSILTAAGTTVAYATVYAAYALYEFLPPAAAFILLGVVALLTLAAALLHGPALAGLGVLGAFAAPLLIGSEEPDYWSLYVYVAAVTGAAFALARARLWRWLAIAAIVLGALWTVPGADLYPVESLAAHVFNVLAGFALAATFLVCGLLYGPPAAPGEIDRLSTLALSVYLLAGAFLVLVSQHDARSTRRLRRPHRRDRRHRMAHGSSDRRGACCSDPRHGGHGRLGGATKLQHAGGAVRSDRARHS